MKYARHGICWSSWRCLRIASLAFAAALPLHAQSDSEITQLPALRISAGIPLRKVTTEHLLLPRAWPAVVSAAGYLYIIGGLDHRPAALSLIERLDLKTGISKPCGNLHIPRWDHRAFILDGKIYIMGGYGFSGNPRPRKLAGVAAGDIDSYFSSEGTQPVLLDSVESFDLATGEVAIETPLPEGRAHFGLIARPHGMLILAGSSGDRQHSSFTNTILAFDFSTRQWNRAGTSPSVGDAVFVRVDPFHYISAGGYDGVRVSDRIFAFDERARAWTELPKLCQPISASTAVFLGKYIFFFGSYVNPEDVVIYNLATKKSEAFSLGYSPARSAAALAIDRYVYIVGGKQTKASDPNNCVQIFELIDKPAGP